MKSRIIKLTEEQINLRLPDFCKIKSGTYFRIDKEATFIDSKYGEYNCIVKSAFRGQNHRLRQFDLGKKSIKLLPEEVEQRLKSHIKLKKETYKNILTECVFVDDIYGEFVAKPSSVLYENREHRSRIVEEWGNKIINATSYEVQTKLPSHLTVEHSSFKTMMEKCKFIDSDYGEFWATPNAILNKKSNHPKRGAQNRKETNIKKYGVEHISQNKDIFSKMKKGMRNSKEQIHWKTLEKFSTVGSYEDVVVQWLNENKINYEWEIPIKLPDDSIYYIDLFLMDENLFIEIKGWFMQDISRQKWELFHKLYPNSELWNREILKAKGFKVK